MKRNYILVIDSGLGGVSILKNLINKLPNENFLYLADNKSSPYGNKSKKFLEKNIIEIINNIQKNYQLKLIVFACNTLTATTINKVRKVFNIKFVGTEPAIKQVDKNERTLILSTGQTLKYCKILAKHKQNKNFDFVELKDVAKQLDENFFYRKKIFLSLKNQIEIKDYKNIVLGCTHYYFLENEIINLLNNDKLKFYKSTKGVTNRVLSLLENNPSEKTNKPEILIKLTKEDKALENTIKFLLTY